MSRLLKRTAWVLAGLVGLLVVAGATIYAAAVPRLDRKYDVAVRPPAPRTDSAAVERGRHVATAIGMCADCHGPDLGGGILVDDPVFGRIAGPNLTAGEGGVGWDYTDADWDRAIRHGVGKDGRALVVMPSQNYQHLSDEDMAALIAYLRQLEPVDRTVPPTTVRLVGRALLLSGKAPILAAEQIDHDAPAQTAAPEPGPTAEYGAYLARANCSGCHGPALSGALKSEIPGAPPPSNLTRLGAWTEADFVRALREGVRPDGAPIDSAMPVRFTRHFTDAEVQALWEYIRTLPEKETGAK